MLRDLLSRRGWIGLAVWLGITLFVVTLPGVVFAAWVAGSFAGVCITGYMLSGEIERRRQ